MVLKFSGKNLSEENFQNIIQDISVLHALHIYPIIVHGAGPQIENHLTNESIKIDGLRVTTKNEIDVIQELLPKLTYEISESMKQWQLTPKVFSDEIFSITPKKFSGYDHKHFTGDLLGIDTDPIKKAILNGMIPVFSSLVFDYDNNPYNINADDIAVQIAMSMDAKKLLFFSDVIGVLDIKKKLIPTITLGKIKELEESGIITGGMIPKLSACKKAIENRVERCHIVSGLEDGAILKEIFTVEGIGTMILDEMKEYRHIRDARSDDMANMEIIRKKLEDESLLTGIHEYLVFEVDGQILGYIQKEPNAIAKIQKKFLSLNIRKMLEKKRDNLL